MTDRKAMQAALDCMEWHMAAGAYGHDIEGTAGMLRELLSEPVQEPVAWMMINQTHLPKSKSLHWTPQTDWHVTWEAVPLYTAPPQRKPLTDEELGKVFQAIPAKDFGLFAIARAIEAAHGIKG